MPNTRRPLRRIAWLALLLCIAAGAYYAWLRRPRPMPAPAPVAAVIAFSREGEGIFTVSPDGGAPKQLIKDGPTWNGDPFAISPDGRWVAVMERGSEEFDNPLVLYQLHPVKRIEPSLDVMGRDLTFTPDSSHLTYLGFNASAEGIFTLRVDALHPTCLLKKSPKHDWMEGPAYAPDGKSCVVYDWGGYPTNTAMLGLWTIDLATGKTRRLTRSEARAPAFSPDGKTIAFDGGDGIYAIGADGTGVRRLTDVRQDHGAEGHGHPAFSPDGAVIAYQRLYKTGRMVPGGEGDGEEEEIDADIYVMRADGTGPRRLCRGWSPCWMRE